MIEVGLTIADTDWEHYQDCFDPHSQRIQTLLRGIKMARHGESYLFRQRTLQEYFAVCSGKGEVERILATKKEKQLKNIMFNMYIFEDAGYLKMFSLLTKDETVRNNLFSLVCRSKETESVQIAAANAITILNKAQITFSYQDFSGIRVSGANLYKAILRDTNLSGADLSYVNFTQAYL